MKGNILIVDDEEQLRKLLSRIIHLEEFNVVEAGTLKNALELLNRHTIDVVLCDVRLPDGNGVDFVRTLKSKFPAIEIVLLTAYGNIADGVQAIKNGEFVYIVKGNDNDRIIPLLHQAMEQKRIAIKLAPRSSISFDSIIGNSASIKTAIKLAKRVAETDSTILLLGETGTGKEVFANSIHSNSKRTAHSIVAVNCSAFNRDLLESELFGHKAGAYTGAIKDKKGLVEVADGGTLFLDEIGEMHLELQAKLLRVLENGEYIKLGDTKVSKTNIRVIAATNRNLSAQVKEGHFREDLYYRLNVFTIELPPLRERVEDIPLFVDHFLKIFAEKENRPLLKCSKQAMEMLQKYSWKGNVRELRNVIQRAAVMVDDGEILPEHLPYEIQKQEGNAMGLSLAAVEKEHIQKILHYTKGNKAKAARLLDIGLATLYRKIEEYELG